APDNALYRLYSRALRTQAQPQAGHGEGSTPRSLCSRRRDKPRFETRGRANKPARHATPCPRTKPTGRTVSRRGRGEAAIPVRRASPHSGDATDSTPTQRSASPEV